MSGKSIDDWFNCTFICAKRFGTSKFKLEQKLIKHPKVIITFADGNHNSYYFMDEPDMNKIESRHPIEISNLNALCNLLQVPEIADIEIDYFERFNIYKSKIVKNKQGQDKLVGTRHHSVPGLTITNHNLAVDQWPPVKIYWLPSENLIQNEYFCSTEKCGYSSDRPDNLKTHEINCTGIQQIITQQVPYGLIKNPIAKFKNLYNINLENESHWAVFDIETFTNGSCLVPVSIAVASTIEKPAYFQRLNDHPQSGFQLVVQFVKYLLKLQQKLAKIQPSIPINAQYIEKQLAKGAITKSEARQSINYLYSYNTLKCFGFNSRKV